MVRNLQFLVLVLFTAGAVADGLAPARMASEQIVRTAEAIAAGRIIGASEITGLSQQQAASLFAAVSQLKAEGRLPQNAADWTALRNLAVKSPNAIDLTSPNSALAFFSAKNAIPGPRAALTPEQIIENAIPKNSELLAYREELRTSGSRSLQAKIEKTGRIVREWQKTPALCSVETRAFCEANAVDIGYKAGELDLDEAFMIQGAQGFPQENPKPKADTVVRGFKAVFAKQPQEWPDRLKSCLLTGNTGVSLAN